ncbi:hypothetical protein KSZ_45280 [Dictyobacter formicarum]|uniref:Uncharacterized protein n=1 Tax=Dictyobacter formicarum TaxID=2778368 RepID=A0ABQ3VK13_9CHLR|nr:hypothetical protein KSZ_45280 [Dictyobacter formicarum]
MYSHMSALYLCAENANAALYYRSSAIKLKYAIIGTQKVPTQNEQDPFARS